MTLATDLRAPMPSAPMKYDAAGNVRWGEMWDDFCILAQDGGPPHRGTMLHAPTWADMDSVAYRSVSLEIVRGIRETVGLEAQISAEAGWLVIPCRTAEQALWLAEAIEQENVATRHDNTQLFVPCGEGFTVKGEIKNVITAVSKAAHYYDDHLAPEVKSALRWQTRFDAFGRKLRSFFNS